MKSMEPALRIGQAAAQLGVSPHHLRQLCKCGLIEAEQSAGGQWRVPLGEVERLAREGVPEAPTFIEEADEVPRPTNAARAPDDLYADPSPDVIEAREEVNIRRSRLEARRLDKEIEETEDFFRERQRRQADEEAARQQAAQAARERQRQADEAARAERRRQEQIRRWEQYALNSLPYGHAQEADLAVRKAVQELLPSLDFDQAQYITKRLIDAAVEQAYRPWRLKKEAEDAKAEHVRTCKYIVDSIYVYGATSDETAHAKAALATCLADPKLFGATRPQLDKLKEAVLKDLKRKVDERQTAAKLEKERREKAAELEAQAQRKRRDAEFKATAELGHIQRYLEAHYKFTGGYSAMLRERDRLRPLILEALVKELLADPNMDADDIRGRIEELIADDEI
jgi:excisionase family DNA binding protein